MTKKRFSKLLSVVLALAICTATVFGCLITASAAEVCYSWQNGNITSNLTKATIDLTIDAPSTLSGGFVGFQFTTDSSELKLTGATVTGGKLVSADEFSAGNFDVTVGENNTVLGETKYDESSNRLTKPCSEVKLTLTFEFVDTNGETTVAEQDKPYSVSIATNTLILTGTNGVGDTYTEGSAKKATIKTRCAHTVDITGLTATTSDAENGYQIYSGAQCTTCKKTFDNQLVPTSSSNKVSDGSLVLEAVNITYADDGTFGINFYYYPATETTPELYVATADTEKFYKLTANELTEDECKALALKSGVVRYTVDNIPARKIDEKLLATAVTTDAEGNVAWGATTEISVGEYAQAVVDGTGIFYPESTEQSVKEKDKAVAQSVIDYGAAAKAALSATNDTAKNVVYMSSENGAFIQEADAKNEGIGDTEGNPYIINTVGELQYIIRQFNANLVGKYFKVNPKIDVFCLQYKDKLNKWAGSIDDFMAMSAEEVKKVLEIDPSKWWSSTTAGYNFMGHIDFSGVEIVGMFSDQGGLFQYISQGATIKNLTLSHSYIKNGDLAGSVVADIRNDDSSLDTKGNKFSAGSVTFENVEIYNNYIYNSNGSSSTRTGALAGRLYGNIGLNYNNLLVYGNVITGGNITSNSALVGMHTAATWMTIDSSFNNSVIVGCYPYPIASDGNKFTHPANWSNVYTDKEISVYTVSSLDRNTADYDITKIFVESITGEPQEKVAACPNLDWTNIWVTNKNGKYPSVAKKGIVISENTDTAVSDTIYYNSRTFDSVLADNGETGANWGNAIIIDSAEELAYLVCNAGNATNGKYYRMADGIKNVVLQPSFAASSIMALDSAAAVEIYFTEEISENVRIDWTNDFSTANRFQGNFDGNGVTIYGMYATGAKGGLFPGFKNETVFETTLKNFSVKNSYVKAENPGVVVGDFYGTYSTTAPYTTTFEGIEIANNVIVSTSAVTYYEEHGGVIYGHGASVAINIYNCFIYDNTIKHSTDTAVVYGLVGNGTASSKDGAKYKIANTVVLGVIPMAPAGDNWSFSNGQYKISNLYFDTDTVSTTFAGNSTRNVVQFAIKANTSGGYTLTNSNSINKRAPRDYDAGSFYKITADGIKGANAKTVMSNLGWNTTWYVGADGEYPTLRKVTADSSDTTETVAVKYNNYGESTATFGLYSSTLSLMSNPHLAFTFAFGVEDDFSYREVRDQINVNVTGANGAVIYNGKPPKYTKNEYPINQDGWTNKENAGRYHLLRLNGSYAVKAVDLYKDITIKVTYNDASRNKDISATFSLEGFAREFEDAYRKTGSDYYNKCREAVNTVIEYSKALDARYGVTNA